MFTNFKWEAGSRWSNELENIWNIELGVNTKFVLWLPRAKQIGLEHRKKQPKKVWALTHWPPPLGMSMLTDSMFFLAPFPYLNNKAKSTDIRKVWDMEALQPVIYSGCHYLSNPSEPPQWTNMRFLEVLYTKAKPIVVKYSRMFVLIR